MPLRTSDDLLRGEVMAEASPSDEKKALGHCRAFGRHRRGLGRSGPQTGGNEGSRGQRSQEQTARSFHGVPGCCL